MLVIGGSAGSLEVILHVLPHLRPDIDFAIIIILHRRSVGEVTLSDLLVHKTSLPVKEVEEKEPLKRGTIYIAPPDYHLLIEKDKTLSLDYSERVHHSRPSIDVTFLSAADVYGPELAGLLLSGANSDGAEGLLAIKQSGGITAIQDPETAEVAYMPRQATVKMKPDHVLTPQAMIAFINGL